MASAVQKITLSPSRDIPFNKLVLSQSNVRCVKAGVSIEELADDIFRRGLLQGLSVRPVVDQAGAETGMFEIPAGGRRYRALELLVKQKRFAKTAPVPCIVCDSGIAEEDSLAENVQRAPLHPLNQFRAFLALRVKGQSEDEIAAAFSVNFVKQRLKLRQALGERPDVAFLAALHVLTLKTFYHYGSDSCLELDLKSVSFGTQAPGLNDSALAEAIRAWHESWAKAVPKESADLWGALREWDGDSQAGLFAHIVSLSVNAVYEPWNRRPRAFAHADQLAQAVDLDMAAAG